MDYNIPTNSPIDTHTNKIMMKCVTPFGASRLISPEDISAEILESLRVSAEAYLKRRPIRDSQCGGNCIFKIINCIIDCIINCNFV